MPNIISLEVDTYGKPHSSNIFNFHEKKHLEFEQLSSKPPSHYTSAAGTL
jgi:hypothetical protein